MKTRLPKPQTEAGLPLPPIVLQRVLRTGAKVIRLSPQRETDPCVCGDTATWHVDCYAQFIAWSKFKKDANPQNCAAWRKFILQNAERIHGGDEAPNPNKTLSAVG